MMKKRGAYTLMVSLVAAIGGFLFGYDWVVIGGAKPFYEVFFDIADAPFMQGWVMGSAIIGCIVGVVISGSFSDRFGRRPLMIAASVIFLLSAVGTGMANTLSALIMYKLAGGVGIGITSALAPIYIAEIVPARSRGVYVSINQLTIVLGILVAQLVNWFIAEPVVTGSDLSDSWNVNEGWRWMFWACAIPALLYLILLVAIPADGTGRGGAYRMAVLYATGAESPVNRYRHRCVPAMVRYQHDFQLCPRGRRLVSAN